MKGTQTGKNQLKYVGDYLITPVKEIVKFLTIWDVNYNIDPINLILDPCAGGLKKSARPVKLRDTYLQPGTPMSYPVALRQMGVSSKIITNDRRKDSPAQYHKDYLKWKLPFKPDLIITNPPFFYIKEITRKCYQDVAVHGAVILLVASTFFTSVARYELWLDLVPNCIFYHSKRMSFWPNKGLDYLNYMHVIWEKHSSGKRPKKTQFTLLPPYEIK